MAKLSFWKKTEGQEPTRENVVLPTRRSQSMLEIARGMVESVSLGGMVMTTVVTTWATVLGKRTFDTPFFTGWTDSACIGLHLSERMVPNGEIVQRLFDSGRPWRLHIEAFLGGSYPVLRTNFGIPCPGNDYLYNEAPLDLTNGDVQEFCTQGLRRDELDLIVMHKDAADSMWACKATANGLSRVLRQALRELTRRPDVFADGGAFKRSVERLEQVYATSRDGIAPSRTIDLLPAGKAKAAMLTL